MTATIPSIQPNPKSDLNLITSQMFARLLGTFKECSDEIQSVIVDMAGVYNSSDATEDEKEAALSTIAEALFPSQHHGILGVCLETCKEELRTSPDLGVRTLLKQMDSEQSSFSDRVTALLDEKMMSQSDLAAAIGVKQPAISMLLSRECRPQRRTVEKIAAALKVSPEEIWPGIKDD
jgi:lambda repressor-like predicted transcriptional regulator